MGPQTQKLNPLLGLKDYGQSVWLDYMRRHLITSGELKRMVEEDGLCGMTSNPSIFEKAIDESADYKEALEAIVSQKGMDAKKVYEKIAIEDIQLAAAVLGPVYRETNGKDGYISMEVSPYLAHDTQGTIEEARRLWKSIGRPNIMIKVPGTPEGMPAIEQLTAEGININITLIFSCEVYEQVMQAYMSGLKKYVIQHDDASHIASVASFFVSRIDSDVDGILTQRLSQSKDRQESDLIKGILGKVAIANAKLAFGRYQQFFNTVEWKVLEKHGARPQRLLWASTSTKNPRYRDVLYVEELIGQNTINTMPPATFEAFKDHGRLRPSLTENIDDARRTMGVLSQLGISFEYVTDQLLIKAVDLFSTPFGNLLAKLQAKIDGGG